MDKMTDAKIRSWLEKNEPDVLEAYRSYQAEVLSDFSMPDDAAPYGPESLRVWMENRHPDLLERIVTG